MSIYTYSITTDFGNDVENLDTETLHKVIESSVSITPVLDSVGLELDVVSIEFESALSTGEQTELDTIVTNHVPIEQDYSIMYGAIVDASGNGDYTSISDAINDGKISIFIRSGVYVETSNIILPNNFYIVGEDKTSVIVHFYGTNSGFVVDGGAPIENVGTVSISNNTVAVTGSGTTFTNLLPYDYIQLGSSSHQIISIESDTGLTLRDSYRGPDLTNVPYKATTYKTGSLSTISMAFSTGSLLTLNKVINVSIKDVGLGMSTSGLTVTDSVQYLLVSSVVYNCGVGITISDSSMFSLSNVIVKNNLTNGVLMTNCESLLVDSLYVYNSGEDGIKLVSGGKNVQITEAISNENKGSGIVSTTTGNILFQSCITSDNGASGTVSSGTGYDCLGGCISSNNAQYGFKLSDNSALTGCVATENNIGVDLTDSTGCVVNSSFVSNNTNDGVLYNAGTQESMITSCQINDNGTHGMSILGTDNIVSLCVSKRNTTANITDGGTTSSVLNNKA